MILYLDTSALVKKYLEEVGSKDIISLWKESMAIATSSITYAETMASFHRKKREANLNETIINATIDSFQKDWESFVRVEVNNSLNEIINKIVALYPLRGFDAIHLASALIIHTRVPQTFLFACYDQRLIMAANSEGLNTFPANHE